ncbi:MAG: tRNA epoxyqueuosine(34) reductase QueG [Anaerolineales bacterium]|nr:tRNA epoxyqueuosine(34) reductase QueG [Chloroflexota bacterium]MBL6982771.1 tRNA epoxyqueuosine(34) reductase QueG [Anaerolineales bacterium]
MNSSSELTQAVKEEARRLGFHHVGVTTPDPPSHLDTYEQWLTKDHHGDMAWMATERARQRRANPRLILPECESILMLGILYQPSPLRPSPNGRGVGGEGKIASYAWGDDYHDVLPDRLRSLVSFIEYKTGQTIPNRWYTDTGPILERELAQRAGLGWIGKNTNLINPKGGSYFLLAEILLGIELSPDEPLISDHCGSCTRCIEACPTDCILPNRTIDSNRCISYLTIELKEPIPQDLRPQIGDWIFGCDICQQVCPWNIRFSPANGDPAFEPRSGLVQLTLKDELLLSPEEFNRKFKGNPVKRTKRRGYLRNIAIALGNMGNPAAVPILSEALKDFEPLIRGHAAWALGQIGGAEATNALQFAAVVEENHVVINEIQNALSITKGT